MRNNDRGFTLVEVVIALFLIAVGVIAAAPLFVFASQETAVGGDLGTIGAAAVRRMEILRGTDYFFLVDGGSLGSNLNGYSDTSDPEVQVRWTIATDAGLPAPTKIITVQAVSADKPIGKRKRVTMVTVRGG